MMHAGVSEYDFCPVHKYIINIFVGVAMASAAAGCEEGMEDCDMDRLAECDEITDWECDGHAIITRCDDGYACKRECTEFCSQSGKSYLGHCALTYNDQTSATGDDICWCL